MKQDSPVLNVLFLVLLLHAPVFVAAAQHERHDAGGTATTPDDRLSGAKRDETACQRVSRLAAELGQEFDALLGVSDPARLQKRLAEHKVKLEELRAATGACSQQCEKRPKRKRCGHMMQH